MDEWPSVSDSEVTTLIDAGNYKGPVYNLFWPERQHLVVCVRAKGTIGDPHYHTGQFLSTKLQIIFVLQGNLLLILEDKAGNTRQQMLSAGQQITIPSYILHGYKVQEDVIYLEPRSEAYQPQQNDTFFEQEWREL
jgi:dTDP-4-dehydrorhamnose 3,5-epimerase-like enzyme